MDIGSTTVKVVAMRDGRVIYRDYRRHGGRCHEHAQAILAEAEAAIGGDGTSEPPPRRGRHLAETPRYVTGSGATVLATTLRASYVHEVHAVAAAVRARFPSARTVIEVGGQDAKMIHFEEDGFASEMNERCAAGTGATLDRCAYRLGLGEDAFAAFRMTGDELPVVSAKCGVFAETDLVGLVKAGIPVARVLAALLDAIVRGNLAVLARGRPLLPQVVLLGGPHAFVPALGDMWRRHLSKRWRERGIPHGAQGDVVVPPNAAFFAAEGALCSAEGLSRVREARRGRARETSHRSLSLVSSTTRAREVCAGLVADGEDVAAQLRRHSLAGRPPGPDGASAARHLAAATGPLAIGMDAGSTTIKAVALDEAGGVRARVYRRAERGPIEDAQDVLSDLARDLGGDVDRVSSFGVTGYAADVLGPVLGADATPVETLAHARSALLYVADADVVCDIGGQDIKVLFLGVGAGGVRGVTRFCLSNQCAAGNGALLEASAHDMNIPMDRYADVALTARRAPVFSVGCAVFLDTERVTCQRDGFSPAEILAGMAAVLPRNVWENVAAAASLPSLGRVFVLSGGVQKNEAALKAQLDYILERHPSARIVVHPYAGEAGAIGAAIAARESTRGGASRFVGFDRASTTRFRARNDESTRCRLCPSACARTVVQAFGPCNEVVRFVTGVGCERGAEREGGPSPGLDHAAAGAADVPSLGLPQRGQLARAASEASPRRGPSDATHPAKNLLRAEASRLFRRAARVRVVSRAGRDLRVGIPRVLSMYRAAPFFTHYFEAIGVTRDRIVIGDATSDDLWRRAAGSGTVDACFPVKVAQAHVADLLARRAERPFDVLFFPILTHAVTAVAGCADTASCPVVAGTPLVTRAAFAADERGFLPGGVLLLAPVLTLTQPARMREQWLTAVRRVAPELTDAEHDAAMMEARAGQSAFEEALERDGAQALERARAERRAAIVMLGRPYHADPGIHHDIGSDLRALGRTTLSIRALPKDPSQLARLGCMASLDLSVDAPSLTNSGDGEKLIAARVVAAHPYLVAIEVSSFKCGQDASLYGLVSDLSQRGGKPFLALHDLDETRPVASLRLRLRTFLDAVARYEEARP